MNLKCSAAAWSIPRRSLITKRAAAGSGFAGFLLSPASIRLKAGEDPRPSVQRRSVHGVIGAGAIGGWRGTTGQSILARCRLRQKGRPGPRYPRNTRRPYAKRLSWHFRLQTRSLSRARSHSRLSFPFARVAADLFRLAHFCKNSIADMKNKASCSCCRSSPHALIGN